VQTRLLRRKAGVDENSSTLLSNKQTTAAHRQKTLKNSTALSNGRRRLVLGTVTNTSTSATTAANGMGGSAGSSILGPKKSNVKPLRSLVAKNNRTDLTVKRKQQQQLHHQPDKHQYQQQQLHTQPDRHQHQQQKHPLRPTIVNNENVNTINDIQNTANHVNNPSATATINPLSTVIHPPVVPAAALPEEPEMFVDPASLGFRVTIDCSCPSNPYAIGPKWSPEAIEEQAYLHEVFSTMPGVFDDEDEDTFDIAMATEYSNEIFNYMRELEYRYLPDSDYMEHQPEINWEKRARLVDWLVRIHEYCNMLPETLFLTVHYIDRFLTLKGITQDKFQLVGLVALFVAAKYEEITFPTVDEVAAMAQNEYSVDEILRAERYLINLLDFNLGWPGPMSFLRRSSKADNYDSDTRTLAKYLLETTVMDQRFVSAPPSWTAAAAHYLSRRILDRGKWSSAHVYFSGYNEEQLKPAVEVMIQCCADASKSHRAIYNKYADARFKKASVHVREWMTFMGYRN